MPARTEITELAVGALVGSVILAAIVHARGFRWLCLVGLACGSLYGLASLGVDGLIGRVESMVAMAGAHPAFFLGVAFGKFAQGLLSLGPLRAARRRR